MVTDDARTTSTVDDSAWIPGKSPVLTSPVSVAPHQPQWAEPDAVPEVLAELSRRHPLVDPAGCRALTAELGAVAAGQAFVIQGGDCAEPFADARADRVRAKAAQLEELADAFEARTGVPVVRIGRFAGQYAKPRSQSTETLPDGRTLPRVPG